MLSVFLSHSSEDKFFVRELAKRLSSRLDPSAGQPVELVDKLVDSLVGRIDLVLDSSFLVAHSSRISAQRARPLRQIIAIERSLWFGHVLH